VKPDYKNGFNKTFQLLSGTEEFINVEIGKLKKHLFRYEGSQVLISIDKLNDLQQVGFYLFELLKPYGFSEDTLSKIPTAFNKTSGKVFFSKTHQLLIDRDDVIISKLEELSSESFWIEPGQIEIDFPVNLVFENIANSKKFAFDPDSNFAYLDFEKLEFPLQLRKWGKGDYFYPLGMKGRKKISDYFIDQKYSLIDKQKAWLLVSGNNIVWIVGQRIDGRYKIDHQTKIIYRISLK
jgi:tRNA(Ile)-lysidine synthase